MSNIPSNLRYTADHEWVELRDDHTIRFGITDYAQAALGDIVFVTLPAVGSSIDSNQACGEVESTKSVSDIFAPVSGEVVAVNDAIETSPETINADPYGAGWIADVKVVDAEHAFQSCLSADEYEASTAG